MRFSKVRLSFGPADSFTFPLDDGTFSAPYVVRSIDGLEPPEISVPIGNSLYEGGYLQGDPRPVNRQLTILMGLQPNYGIGQTPSDLRDALYGLLTPKYGVPLTFSLLDDASAVVVSTQGRIKTFEAPLWAKDSMVQMVLPCVGPYLEKPLYVHPSPGTLLKNPIVINNSGNAPTGFDLTIVMTAAMSSFTLTNGIASQKMLITYPFTIGDEVRINTRAGERTLSVKRAGVTTSLLPYLSTDSTYIQLHGGANSLTPSSSSFTISAISYYPRFWGA